MICPKMATDPRIRDPTYCRWGGPTPDGGVYISSQNYNNFVFKSITIHSANYNCLLRNIDIYKVNCEQETPGCRPLHMRRRSRRPPDPGGCISPTRPSNLRMMRPTSFLFGTSIRGFGWVTYFSIAGGPAIPQYLRRDSLMLIARGLQMPEAGPEVQVLLEMEIPDDSLARDASKMRLQGTHQDKLPLLPQSRR